MTHAITDTTPRWVAGFMDAAEGRRIPVVTTKPDMEDILGAWKVRWGIGRTKYGIEPGLYATGKPDERSPVLVTANYKLTFDSLRKELPGLDAWILVLDTKGVNVWCAAGKGTFGTAELVERIGSTGLKSIVSHHTLILPQLGAPGVAAFEVTHRTGFKVVYGPVRASDIPEFLKNGMKADPLMRTVRFDFRDRIRLVPMELTALLIPALVMFALSLIFTILTDFTTDPAALIVKTLPLFTAFIGSGLVGAALVPALLPFIPGKALSFKGWLLGLVWAAMVVSASGAGIYASAFFLLALPAVSSYAALNFTGATTYTSLSGVLKEMKYALPLLLASAIAGLLALSAGFAFGF